MFTFNGKPTTLQSGDLMVMSAKHHTIAFSREGTPLLLVSSTGKRKNPHILATALLDDFNSKRRLEDRDRNYHCVASIIGNLHGLLVRREESSLFPKRKDDQIFVFW